LFYKNISSKLIFFYCYYIIPIVQIIRYFILKGDNFSIKKKRIQGFTKYCNSEKIKRFIEISDKQIDSILKPEALSLIRKLKENPFNEIYIVSASFNIILSLWTEREKIRLITNELETKEINQKREWKLINQYDCDGIGKVLRIKKEIVLSDYSRIIAFGDSPNDFNMFEIADLFYYKTLDVIHEI